MRRKIPPLVPLFGVLVELENNINYILRFYLTLRLSLRF
jgi:hypothetical protein